MGEGKVDKKHVFQQSGERTSGGEFKNSCLYCGKTAEAHDLAKIEIVFQGKLWQFNSVEEAREYGFYLY